MFSLFSVVAGSSGQAGPPPSLPAIADNNAVFNDEGGSTSGWTAANATLTTDGTYVRETKGPTAGSSSSMTKSLGGFVSNNQDYILYGKARASDAASNIGVIWLLNGAKEVSIWFGSATANSVYAAQTVSICGTTGASTRNVVSLGNGFDFDVTPIEFALHFDFKFSSLNCYFKEAGIWALKGRVACDWFSSADIAVLNTSNSPNGSWVERQFLTLARVNIVAIGDSITEGKTLYSPNLALGLANYSSCWMAYSTIYPSLRNSLVVNKGVGSNTSTQILARITDATGLGARVVFLQASDNDEAAGISQATRTANIQACANAIVAAAASCVLLNGTYGTQAGPDNQPTPDLRDYMLAWWDVSRLTLVNVALSIDTMQNLLSAGFQNPALTQADGLHPTPAGHAAYYAPIGALPS